MSEIVLPLAGSDKTITVVRALDELAAHLACQ